MKITVNEDFNNVLLKQAQMHLYLLEHQNNPIKSAQFFQEKIIENEIIYKSLAQPLAKQLLNGHKKNLPALKWLAKSPIGRKHFFQFFVDEDDLSGIYTHSLTNLYDASTKNEQDLIFSKLFFQLFSKQNCRDLFGVFEVSKTSPTPPTDRPELNGT